MPIVPTLITYSATDTDYVEKWNSNNAAILDSFSAVEVSLSAAFQAQGILSFQDWIARISTDDQLNGVIGPYSLVFSNDDTNSQVQLLASRASGVSVVGIAGIRIQHSGDLIASLSSLNLSPGDHVVYVGVDLLGSADFSAGISTDPDDLTLSLYSFDLEVDGSVQEFVVTNVQREDRTLLWDNTFHQLELERSRPFEFVWHEAAATPDDVHIFVPFAHKLVNLSLLINASTAGASAVWDLVAEPAGLTQSTLAWDESDSDDVIGIVKKSINVAALGIVRPANQVYRVNRTFASGVISSGLFSIEVVPVYNVPVIA